ncbi:MAG: WD40 repeat domain-containing protein [Anaerolineae bacterium]
MILLTSNGFGLSVDNTPITLIRTDNFSGLDRPEGVAFTPSGDYVATANSLGNTITFYKRIGEQGAVYETTPSFCIKGSESQLDFPHDLSFSPDGTHLAVANRQGNSITIYKKNLSLNRYDPIPVATIKGIFSQIAHPDAVRYSPIENIIAVANIHLNTLTFYHYQGDQYDQQPYQVIRNSILKVPDGLDFSKDGALLAVTSHSSHSVILYQRISNSQGLYRDNPIQILEGEETHFCYPHSLAFHPLKNYLAVSCSQGRKNVHIFANESESPTTAYLNAPELSLEIIEMYDESNITLLDHLLEEGGVKGIAFAPDGKSLAITQNLCQDILRLPSPVGVLAIYPMKID